MRLIDADAALENVPELKHDSHENCGICILWDRYEAREFIKEQPTVDAEPVRHGRWEPDKNYMREETGYWRCPLCMKISRDKGEYCSHCGAKMDLKED